VVDLDRYLLNPVVIASAIALWIQARSSHHNIVAIGKGHTRVYCVLRMTRFEARGRGETICNGRPSSALQKL